MNRKLIYRTLALVLVASAGWMTSCKNDSNTPTTHTTNSRPQLIAVTPSDGALGVSPNDSVTMKFNLPMDTTSVSEGFHMAGGQSMTEWMDSLTHMGGMMGHMMDTTKMMHWMDSIQAGGRFHWNSRQDSCSFIPDAMMASNSQQLVYVRSCRAANGIMMRTDTMQFGGYMVRFTTGP